MKAWYLTIGLVLSLGIAHAGPSDVSPGGITAQAIPSVNYYPTAAQLRRHLLQIKLASLRREALVLQQQDGGTLSQEHHAMLQAKLDHINARWR